MGTEGLLSLGFRAGWERRGWENINLSHLGNSSPHRPRRNPEKRERGGRGDTDTANRAGEPGHPPDIVVPEPSLEKALKNWKQTHRQKVSDTGLRTQHWSREDLQLRPSYLGG